MHACIHTFKQGGSRDVYLRLCICAYIYIYIYICANYLAFLLFEYLSFRYSFIFDAILWLVGPKKPT